jgi:AraC family transcriptional regulator
MALESPRIVASAMLHIVGLAKRYPLEKLALVPVQWADLRVQVAYITGRVGGDFHGLWYNLFSGAPVATLVTGVRVGEFAPVNPSLSMTQVAAQSYAVFSHRGPVAEIRETVAEIGRDWLPRSGYKHFRVDDGAPDFIERYGEGFDPKAGAGDVEIWLPVAK